MVARILVFGRFRGGACSNNSSSSSSDSAHLCRSGKTWSHSLHSCRPWDRWRARRSCGSWAFSSLLSPGGHNKKSVTKTKQTKLVPLVLLLVKLDLTGLYRFYWYFVLLTDLCLSYWVQLKLLLVLQITNGPSWNRLVPTGLYWSLFILLVLTGPSSLTVSSWTLMILLVPTRLYSFQLVPAGSFSAQLVLLVPDGPTSPYGVLLASTGLYWGCLGSIGPTGSYSLACLYWSYWSLPGLTCPYQVLPLSPGSSWSYLGC